MEFSMVHNYYYCVKCILFLFLTQQFFSTLETIVILHLLNMKKKKIKVHKCTYELKILFMQKSRTIISQDVQTRFPVQLAFAKFLSKIKENF